MASTVSLVKAESPTPKPQRDRIVLIEEKPKDDWFVRTRTSLGREVWYLRFHVTGQIPKLFGPFKSKHQCLLFLDDALDVVSDFEGELVDQCRKRMLHETCQKIWPPIVEHPLVAQLQSATKKGR